MPPASLLVAALALIMTTAGSVVAGDRGGPQTLEQGVVLELYTAQGCVACPPVEAYFATLADRPDVIALALHVDYWDYIGWKDTFADPAFTERQKGYARRARSNTIYTPQMIVGGIDSIQGFRPMEVRDHLTRHASRPAPVALTLEQDGERLTIRAHADPPLEHAVVVQLVRYIPSVSMRIKSGENAGRRGTYHNIVTAWEDVGRWDGTEALVLRVPAPGNEPVVVIVQETGHGPILAAGRLR